jgi:hypothetical protein
MSYGNYADDDSMLRNFRDLVACDRTQWLLNRAANDTVARSSCQRQRDLSSAQLLEVPATAGKASPVAAPLVRVRLRYHAQHVVRS